MAVNVFNITGGTSASWLANTVVAIQNQADSGLIGSLARAAKNKPGSISSFLASSASNDLVTISATSTSSMTQLALARGDAVKQAKANAEMEKKLKELERTQSMVQPKNVLDPIIYLGEGSTLDTRNNIITHSDGKQYDATSGAPYVDPANIVQLSGGAYLNTATNVMTLGDGTQIDMITGLHVDQLNGPED